MTQQYVGRMTEDRYDWIAQLVEYSPGTRRFDSSFRLKDNIPWLTWDTDTLPYWMPMLTEGLVIFFWFSGFWFDCFKADELSAILWIVVSLFLTIADVFDWDGNAVRGLASSTISTKLKLSRFDFRRNNLILVMVLD